MCYYHCITITLLISLHRRNDNVIRCASHGRRFGRCRFRPDRIHTEENKSNASKRTRRIMADDEETPQTSYEYLDGEQETTTWLSRAGKCRVTYPNGAVYEGQFNDLKQKHGLGKSPVSKSEQCPVLTFSFNFPNIQVNTRTSQR